MWICCVKKKEIEIDNKIRHDSIITTLENINTKRNKYGIEPYIFDRNNTLANLEILCKKLIK